MGTTGTMVRGALAAVLLIAFAPCSAQTIYKCVAPGAPPSYQQSPCARGARTVSSLDVRPEPPPTPDQSRRTASEREQARRESDFLARRAGTARPQGTGRTTRARGNAQPTQDACADARRRRDAWEQAVGLRRTFNDLRAWNDRVREACR